MGNQQLRIGGDNMEFVEKLKYVFGNNHIEVLTFTHEKKPIEYKCLDCGKVYNYKCARNLLARPTLCKNCYNPFSRWNKERMQERMKKLFPESDFEVLELFSLRDGGFVKCNKCGTIEKINNFESLLSARKDYFCNECEKERNRIYSHMQEELKKGNLELLKWNGVNEKSEFKCTRCGHIFTRRVSINFDGDICPNCFKVYNKFSFEQGQDFLNKHGDGEYTLIQFTGMNTKSLIKHKCGFIYSTSLSSFDKTRGCPKCYKKISQGERAVMKFLEESSYDYEYQKKI